MAEVQNDSEEDVDYGVEEGPAASGLRQTKRLRRGQVVTVPVSTEEFDILFFNKGDTLNPLVSKEGIHKDSYVTLSCLAKGRWKIEVRPSKAAAEVT